MRPPPAGAALQALPPASVTRGARAAGEHRMLPARPRYSLLVEQRRTLKVFPLPT